MKDIIKNEIEQLNSIQELIKQLSEKINKYSTFCYDNKIEDETNISLLNDIDHMDILTDTRKLTLELRLETENGK